MSESWPLISAEDAIMRLRNGARGLDVRSQKEFAQGALPDFQNVPILNDEHRHLVGLAYKEQGQARAIELGHELVGPLRSGIVAAWQSIFKGCEDSKRVLICWRGGLRSEIAARWLAESGWTGARVAGGYKAIRNELLSSFTNLPPLVVLGGLTGAGKTEVLSGLSAQHAVDLEKLAAHRGSAFGLELGNVQPSQQTFESALGLAFWRREQETLVEDEGVLIGTCALPQPLRDKMLASPVIVLESSMFERVCRIFSEYVEQPLARFPRGRVRQHLLDSLERIHRRLGGLRTSEIRSQIQDAFAVQELSVERHSVWIESLLTEYYDPQYEYGLKRHNRPVLFRGDVRAVQDFLAHRLGGRGT